MTVSVCMGIYNGSKYIEKQLNSILHQTKSVDEVILCDDNSKDNTVEIVKTFIAQNKLEDKWKLYENKQNKGYPGNFYYAMSLCSKDIVFLSDQDDIWHERKIEKMCEVFEEHSDINSVCCKFGLIDVADKKIRTIMEVVKSRETGKICNVTLKDVFYKCQWPGMVMAYRRKWYEKKMAAWNQRKEADVKINIPHDFVVAAWAAEENSFFQLDLELAQHRQHGENVGGKEYKITKLLCKEHKIAEIKDYISYLEEFEKNYIFADKEAKDLLTHKKSIMRERLKNLMCNRTGAVLKNAWKNREDIRIATAVCDLILTMKV